MSTSTICAVSTASGGAIGVVRVSGSQAISITEHIFRAVNGKPLSERKASSLTFGHIVDENNNVVDEVLVSLFALPIPTQEKRPRRFRVTVLPTSSSAWCSCSLPQVVKPLLLANLRNALFSMERWTCRRLKPWQTSSLPPLPRVTKWR